ncbi:MAG: hypothetical protein ACPLRW_09900 [Moorellales bacterium]
MLSLRLGDDFERAVFIALLNAVLRYLGLVSRTGHCRDEEPRLCAAQLVRYVSERFGRPKIAFIGLQPAMVEALASRFELRVTDLDPDNIGQHKCGVTIEGEDRTPEIIAWADMVLATGSTQVREMPFALSARALGGGPLRYAEAHPAPYPGGGPGQGRAGGSRGPAHRGGVSFLGLGDPRQKSWGMMFTMP